MRLEEISSSSHLSQSFTSVENFLVQHLLSGAQVHSSEEAELAAFVAHHLAPPSQTALTYREQLKERIRLLSTGCACIDELLGGGVFEGSLTELAGESSSGKTQLCHMAAACAACMGERVVYVDTTNSFSASRLAQIVYQLPDGGGEAAIAPALSHVSVHQCHTAHALAAILEALTVELSAHKSGGGLVQGGLVQVAYAGVTSIPGEPGPPLQAQQQQRQQQQQQQQQQPDMQQRPVPLHLHPPHHHQQDQQQYMQQLPLQYPQHHQQQEGDMQQQQQQQQQQQHQHQQQQQSMQQLQQPSLQHHSQTMMGTCVLPPAAPAPPPPSPSAADPPPASQPAPLHQPPQGLPALATGPPGPLSTIKGARHHFQTPKPATGQVLSPVQPPPPPHILSWLTPHPSAAPPSAPPPPPPPLPPLLPLSPVSTPSTLLSQPPPPLPSPPAPPPPAPPVLTSSMPMPMPAPPPAHLPKVSLLIIDSLSAVISPVLGMPRHSQGHTLLACISRTLRGLALHGPTAVLLTNHLVAQRGAAGQAAASTAAAGARGLGPAMGESWRNQAHTRLQLMMGPRGAPDGPRQAILTKSCIKAAGESRWFTITEAGLSAASTPACI